MTIRLVFLSMCCLVLGNWNAHTLADDVDLNDLKSRSARSAVSAYQRKVDSAERDYKKIVSDAEKEYEKVVVKERGKLIDELEDVLKKETSNGNLEEAIELKEVIESLKKLTANTPDPDQDGNLMRGIWKVRYNSGEIRYQKFLLKNGQPYTIRYLKIGGMPFDQGVIKFQDGVPYASYEGRSKVESFTLRGDKIFVEHWDLKVNESTDRLPDDLALAIRVEEQTE